MYERGQLDTVLNVRIPGVLRKALHVVAERDALPPSLAARRLLARGVLDELAMDMADGEQHGERQESTPLE